jgi:hypothetical protein
MLATDEAEVRNTGPLYLVFEAGGGVELLAAGHRPTTAIILCGLLRCASERTAPLHIPGCRFT